MPRFFADVYKGRTVLVTGHTGFKGSWLCLWLQRLGARVVGYSLPAPTDPSHRALLGLSIQEAHEDVRDAEALEGFVRQTSAEIVFHLAAQPLVRRSYREPSSTFGVNVQGTVNVLEACRASPSVRAVVCVTSDKTYENRESPTGYEETDRLGGSDPYSCSKACAELITACYRRSYFPPESYGATHQVLVASVRAGNVVGGGDWAEDRLLPDAVRAAVGRQKLLLRNPNAVRPWQHVLEPLSGYLLVGQCLLEGRREVAEAFNFGPADEGAVEVETVVRRFASRWPDVGYAVQQGGPPPCTRRGC